MQATTEQLIGSIEINMDAAIQAKNDTVFIALLQALATAHVARHTEALIQVNERIAYRLDDIVRNGLDVNNHH